MAQQAFGNWTSTHAQPFTPAWYWQHPNAWHVTHPYANEAVAATAATLATWLATVPYAAVSTGTVVVEETIVIEESAPAEMPMEEEVAMEEAADVSAQQEWVTLGVYELLAPGEDEATRLIELAVARDGDVGGNHFDRALGDVDSIHGHADPQSMRLSWSVGQGTAVFQATFDELMQPEGRVSVQMPEGETAQWRIVRQGP